MPFIPHTEEDIRAMLDAIGVSSVDELFDEIPPALRSEALEGVPEGIGEMEVSRLMSERAEADGQPLCFVGAGAYRHHIPAAVWDIATRGELYSAYTPYQAEASQGTLQIIYEYQTMMAGLTAMEVSNASLYDGASALAEAVLMAVRVNRKSRQRRILMPRTVHPDYRRVVRTLTEPQGIVLEELDYDRSEGHIDPDSLPTDPGDFAALVIPQPNFFGVLEEVDALTDWARRHGALVVGVVNPTALALLPPPGEWGEAGADIVCGEGQPLGAPLSCGGPYFGFMTCKRAHVRQMPGRIVGGTVDLDGKRGYTLTLQAREQHIRRSKATSNICTNQGLMVTAATIYMSLLGPAGLERVAGACHANTRRLVEKLTEFDGLEQRFPRPMFHEAVLTLSDVPVKDLLRSMAAYNILGGYSLRDDYPELGNAWLVCATEMRSEQDLETYRDHVRRVLETRRSAGCPTKPKF
jgi:glycine dehydrogenase subunit 1